MPRNVGGHSGGHRGPRAHNRDQSAATSINTSNLQEPPPSNLRRHNYDLEAMEAAMNAPRPQPTAPIPAPQVSVRGEFPSLTKSRQQQSLTCLVTVEVAESKWVYEDPQAAARAPQTHPQVKSPRPAPRQQPRQAPPIQPPRRQASSASMVMQTKAQELRRRVDNWHGLDMSR